MLHNSSLLIKRYIIDQLDLSQLGVDRNVKVAAVKHAEECKRGDAAVSSHTDGPICNALLSKAGADFSGKLSQLSVAVAFVAIGNGQLFEIQSRNPSFSKLGFLLFTDFVQIQSYFLHIQKQSVWIVLPPDC